MSKLKDRMAAKIRGSAAKKRLRGLDGKTTGEKLDALKDRRTGDEQERASNGQFGSGGGSSGAELSPGGNGPSNRAGGTPPSFQRPASLRTSAAEMQARRDKKKAATEKRDASKARRTEKEAKEKAAQAEKSKANFARAKAAQGSSK